MPDRFDYVAIKNGNAYALMAEEYASKADVRQFYRENAGADIRLMPRAEAVALHRRHIVQSAPGIEAQQGQDPKELGAEHESPSGAKKPSEGGEK